MRTCCLVALAFSLLLAPAGALAADAPVTARLDPTGLLHLTRGNVEVMTLELNAHGPQWKHAPQSTATATVTDLPNQTGKRLEGVLPVPNTDGAIRFIQTVKTVPAGLQVAYDLAMTTALKLNGLQVSLNLPVAVHATKELMILRPTADPAVVNFPEAQDEQGFVGWGGEGYRVEVARGTENAVTVELRAATDISVQDLRRWGTPCFELRFPAISDDAGRDVSAEDRFHLDLTIMAPGGVKLMGP